MYIYVAVWLHRHGWSRGSFRLLIPFPQKFRVTHAQSIPSALATTVKVISLQFRSLQRTFTLPHTALPSISSPPSSHTQSSAAPAFQTPSTARPCLKQLKLCQTSNMLAGALYTMCLPEANDLFVYVKESHYQELSRKKNKWKQNQPKQNRTKQNRTWEVACLSPSYEI